MQRAASDPVIGEGAGTGPGFEVEGAVVLVSLLFEARAFGFPTREIQWGSGGGESSIIEEALAAGLDPIEFEYGFFQATGGVVFSF